MEKLLLANALEVIDFDLLISDNVRNTRGQWGEIIEIKLPKGVVFVYVDENSCGFIKLYDNEREYVKIGEKAIVRENLVEEMKVAIDKMR